MSLQRLLQKHHLTENFLIHHTKNKSTELTNEQRHILVLLDSYNFFYVEHSIYFIPAVLPSWVSSFIVTIFLLPSNEHHIQFFAHNFSTSLLIFVFILIQALCLFRPSLSLLSPISFTPNPPLPRKTNPKNCVKRNLIAF